MNCLHPTRASLLTLRFRALRPFGFLFAMVLALVVVPGTVFAQDSATGTISGRVLNGSNGKALSKALVSVQGTTLTTLTNDFGEFTLRNVPAGAASLHVSYTGIDPTVTQVTVGAGTTTLQDITLAAGGSVGKDGTVMLDPFTIESGRFKSAADIAINEERYSVNIKNVVAADAFGDIPSGNVGEFIKFLPGVEISYGGTYTSETDASGISVRGFGPEDTAIYIDGVPISSASPASLSNAVGLDMMSINNASRVELVKVATPDMPNNSIGGSINLISKSAFEYSKPTVYWKAYMTINSEDPNVFKKIAGPTDEKIYGSRPGFDLTYAHPINDRIGISVTLSRFSQFSENRRFRPEWTLANVTNQTTNLDLRPLGGATGVTATNALGQISLANPFLTRVSISDDPRFSTSNSGSLKVDWRPLPGLSLSGSYQISTYESADAVRRLQIRIQRPQTWDATSTISYPYVQAAQSANGAVFTPNSTLDMNIDSRDKEGITHTGFFRAIYKKGPWDIFALASASTSRGSYKDVENGHFSTVDVSSSIGRIAFENIQDGVPGSVKVDDRFGVPFNFTDLSKWNTPTIQARSGKAESLDDVFNYKFDLRRELDFLPWNAVRLAFKTGFLREETLKKKWGLGTGYRQTYVGPALSTADYLDNTYVGYDPGFGFAPQQWISTYRLYDIYAANPAYFNANSDSDQVNNYNSYVGQNKRIKEVKNAWYAMIDGSALNNRLNFVAGLRSEDAKRTGFGPATDSKWNFLKLKDGTLYRDASNPNGVRFDQATSPLFATTAAGTALRSALTTAGVTYPTTYTPISTSTLAGRMLNLKALQPVYGESKGDPSYSINAAYDITKKLVGKVAWSRSFGRIPLESGTVGLLTGGGGGITINEAETAGSTPAGTISIANPNLLPNISTNWDFALTYYTERGGKLGVSYYTKAVKNFEEQITTTSSDPTFALVLDSLGLDPTEYEGWNVTTAVNGIGTGKVNGYELEVFQDFRFLRQLGEWGKRINVFATYSHSKRSETNTTRISARPAASSLATAGVTVSPNRLSFNIKATWRDLTLTQSNGNVVYNGVTYQLGTFDPSVTKVDANFNWQFSKKYGFFVSGRDILNQGSRKERMDMGGIYPAYAQWDDIKEFGVQITFGIKGSF
ncbi:MAG: carboxypeptidase regulatory-like domain-containing protein [Opitutaceae bacterium]|nr:carboxypeptidase regulatory-like domain-containing protein [Opitutaceae bacterium]